MAAATQPTYVPLEIYLKSSYEPDAEYVDGVIEERPAAQWDHADWHSAVQVFFGSRRIEFGIRVRPSLRIRTGPNTIRVPDVTILDRNLPTEQIVTHAPIAVFEILSPEDSMTRTLEKLADYERMGIGAIWVIEPKKQIYLRYREGQLAPGSVFALLGSQFSVSFAEIAELMD